MHEYKILASIILFAGVLGFLSPLVSATAETNYAVYNDMQFTAGTDFSSLMFFSTYFINDTKYFAIACNTTTAATPRIEILRFTNLGVLEDKRSEAVNCSNISESFYLQPATREIEFAMRGGNSTLYLMEFNITNYIANATSIKYQGTIKAGVDDNSDLISISSQMTKGAYGKDIVNVAGSGTIGVTYGYGGNYYVAWNFYDTENKVWNGTNITTDDISIYLTNVGKLQAIPSENNCVYYTSCIWHILVQGSSASNSNLYGIYLREQVLGLWDYDYYDHGLVGYGSGTGFDSGAIGGITTWFYTEHYSTFSHKIYIDAVQGNDRIFAYLTYNPTWNQISEDRLNNGEINALQPYAKNLTYQDRTKCTQGACAGKFVGNSYGGYNFTNYVNNSWIYYFGTGIWHHPNDAGATAYPNVTVMIRSSSNYSIKTEQTTTYATNVGASDKYGRLSFMGRIANIPASNIDIFINGSENTGTDERWFNISEASMDVLSNNSKLLGTVTQTRYSKFYITRDNSNEVESYLVYNNFLSMGAGTYTAGAMENGVSQIGVQTVSSSCVCTSYTYSCFNTTTTIGVRDCAPSYCILETTYYENLTCSTPVGGTTDTGLTGGINDTLITPVGGIGDALGNITGAGGFGKLIGVLMTPFFWATGGMLALATFIAMKVKNNAGSVFLAVCVVMMIVYGVLGVYPIWILVVFLLIGVFFLARMFIGSDK